MNGDRSARRDADRLAALLEDYSAVATAPEEDRILAELAAALRAVPVEAPPMRQAFREELRASVLDAAREQRSGPPLLTRLREGARRARYSTAAMTGVGTAALALSGGGVAAAAEYAQPDDLLYDVKLALEDLRLTLTGDDGARGERGMTYAVERLAEALAAATAGEDAGAAEALHNAADRTAAATEAVIASGMVEPVVDLAGQLTEVAGQLEALRPSLGVEGTEAADALRDVLVAATQDVLDVIDVSQWPAPGIPAFPDLELPGAEQPDPVVPEQTAPPSATPVPDVTTPPTPPPSPGAPTGEVPPPSGGQGLPAVPGPALPGPSVPAPVLPPATSLPDLPLDSPLPDVTEPVGEVLDGVGEVVDDLGQGVDGAGGALGEAVDDVIDAVPSPVQTALPDPVEDAVDALPGAVDDVVDVVPEVLETVPDVVDGVGDAVDQLLPGAADGGVPGILGGG